MTRGSGKGDISILFIFIIRLQTSAVVIIYIEELYSHHPKRERERESSPIYPIDRMIHTAKITDKDSNVSLNISFRSFLLYRMLLFEPY
jgi:hypothetical protein